MRKTPMDLVLKRKKLQYETMASAKTKKLETSAGPERKVKSQLWGETGLCGRKGESLKQGSLGMRKSESGKRVRRTEDSSRLSQKKKSRDPAKFIAGKKPSTSLLKKGGNP